MISISTIQAEPKIVLAVSQDTSRPRAPDGPDTDYWRLAADFDAPVVGNTGHACSALARRFEAATALDFSQAAAVLRDYPDADAYLSFSEKVGIPLAIMLRRRKRRPAHVIIAHRLDTRAKRLLEVFCRWSAGVDRIVVLCGTQLGHAQRFLPGASVFVKAGITDEQFYRPSDVEDGGYALSVGSENRDYETLTAAADRAGMKLKVLASSPWCRKKRGRLEPVADAVEFLPRVSYPELRDLYDRSRLVVVPLNDVEYVAGLNGVLEAFCMGKPLVVSASRGVADYVTHMRNALVVPVGDVDAMAEAMRAVSTDADLREKLRSGAREAVRGYANLGAYVQRLAEEIRAARRGTR